MQNYFKTLLMVLVGLIFIATTIADAAAANRKGSYRSYPGPGKGSTYKGGEKSTSKTKTDSTKTDSK